ncbi:MAG TPA: PKD domain-containing protein, partial [Solirubrobacteraceae bacterium]
AFVTQLVESQETDQVVQFDVDPGGQLRPSAAPVPAGVLPVAIAISPDGGNAYVANAGSGDVSQYDIRDGRLVARTPASVPAGTATVDVVVSQDGKSVYAVNAETGGVSQYDRAADGGLTPKKITAIPMGDSPRAMAFLPGRTQAVIPYNDVLGVVAVGPDSIVHQTPRPDGPYVAVATAPNDHSAYAAYESTPAIGQFNVARHGQPVPKAPAVATPTKALALTVSGDGHSLYAVLEDRVAQYDLDAEGRLTPKAPAELAIPGAVAIAVTPNQGPVAAISATLGAATEPSTFDARAAHDPDGRIARYDWDFGDGTVATDAGPTPAHVFAAPGDHRVTVTVTDDGGCSTGSLFEGHVALCSGGPAARATLVARVALRPLAVSNLKLRSRWRIASSVTSAKDGTTITWDQTRPAPVTLRFERILAGRKVGGRCRAPTRRTRSRAKCTRLVRAYAATVPGVRGANSRRFVGWSFTAAKAAPLKPGRYLVTLTATDRGERAVVTAKTTLLAARR